MLAAAMGPESFTGGPLGSSPEQSLGRQIGGGHALVEHLGEFEALGIKTEQQFSQHIDDVVSKASGTDVRQLSRGRTAYWNGETGTVVIHDPKSADAGTAFRPTRGRAYFDDLK
jgi:filamentous hemagglutinin